jgi:putative ABC transport system permease protein
MRVAGWDPVHTTLQDLRYAIRLLFRDRLFTFIAVAMLALGIGANSAIFAVVNAVLLRPLPYRDPGRIVQIEELIPTITRQGMAGTPRDVLAFQRNSKAFSAVAGFTPIALDLTGQSQPERLPGARVSAELFAVLGVQPMLGRSFTPAEDHPGSGVAVISYDLWQRRFGGSRAVVGSIISLDRQPVRILGVMAKDFEFPLPGMYFGGKADVWAPMGFTPYELSPIGLYNFAMIARLKPGVSLDQAEADVRAVAHGIWENYPPQVRAQASLDARVAAVAGLVVKGSRDLLWLLGGAVALVLLIACVNCASLLVARAVRRERELTVRVALGASRARLLRQLLTESVLLGAVGGATGLLLGAWLAGLMARVVPASVPRASTIELDWRVAGFTAAIALLAGLVFGTVPALVAARSSESGRWKAAVRGATASHSRARLRGFLVASEVALSMVLLVSAGLLVRSLAELSAVQPGFDLEHVLTGRVSLPAQAYGDAASIRGFYQRAVDQLAALPGVRSAGAATAGLLAPERGRLFVVRDPAMSGAISEHREVLGNYFQTVGIPLRRGRLFDYRDRPGSPPVLVINETLAHRYFLKQDPIGQQIKLSSRQSPEPWYTIIGVVADSKTDGLAKEARPQTYEAYSQLLDVATRTRANSMVLAVRASGAPDVLASAMRAVVARLDPELPVTSLESTRAMVEKSLAPQSFQTWLVGTFAALAMLLAAAGIYGVVSYAVLQRTQEIGVRMALGASRGSVVGMVVRQGMKFALAGVALGLCASLALTRVLTGFLYGIKPTDAVTFALTPVLLCLVALAASFAPARRAARIAPASALREE